MRACSWTSSRAGRRWTRGCAGFEDTWLQGRPRGDGFTANQQADLLNAESQRWHRIDYGLFRTPNAALLWDVNAKVIGARQRDRTANSLWPSDHAGVATVLRIR